jgi:light-regulated signal transduction histidine kinase (bacteriophytochrome)
MKITGILLAALIVIGGVGGYLYWQSLKRTPQYSLALLIDAARRNDQADIDNVVDINAVVDDFVPQITGKAIDMYGRGLPPSTIGKVASVAAPMMPAVKDRARAELPDKIRERTEKFKYVPMPAIVVGADKYLDISIKGDDAVIKSKQADRPLEVRMKRNGDRWQVVAVKDDELATQIARQIGQEIIAVAANGGVDGAAERLGISDLQNILQRASEILR